MIVSMVKLAIVAKPQNRCKVFVKTDQLISFLKYQVLSLRTRACYTHVNTSLSGCGLGIVDTSLHKRERAGRLSIFLNGCSNAPTENRLAFELKQMEFSRRRSRAMTPLFFHRMRHFGCYANFLNGFPVFFVHVRKQH